MISKEEERIKRRELYHRKQKKKSWIFWIILGLFWFLLLFGWFFWGIIGVNLDYSSGERVGRIVKISERGLIWKSSEIELVIAQESGFMTTYVWEFSIDRNDPNEEVLKEALQEAFYSGKLVRIKYEQKAGHVPWRGKTSYFIKSITFLE